MRTRDLTRLVTAPEGRTHPLSTKPAAVMLIAVFAAGLATGYLIRQFIDFIDSHAARSNTG